MKLLHGFDEPTAYRGGYVAIGNFDGVHRGHQSMIDALVRRARQDGAPAVVLTFEPHPISLLRPEQTPPRLMLFDHKVEIFEARGVDCVIAYRTDWNLLNLSPAEFFERIVVGEMNARGLVEGPNFFFGKDRAGNVETLKSLCEAAGLSLEVVPSFSVDGKLVSSSSVRRLIASGDLRAAVEMLGHPYRIRGIVARGAARGRALGFPTANLEQIEVLLPPHGVYAGIAKVDGTAWPAAVHRGPNATFGESESTFEVHLAGFTGDLYGRTLEVDLLERLRDTTRFSGIEELKAQLARDVEQTRAVVNRRPSR